MNLNDQVEAVEDRAQLVAFIQALSKEFIANPRQWQHETIDQYLEALGAWIDDMDGYFINQGQQPPKEPTWKLFAQICIAAKYYE